MLNKVCLGSLILYGLQSLAQELPATDTVRQLNEVVVTAFQYNRSLLETPASVGVVGPKEFQRLNESTLVPSFNMVPGVRLEERSPGSYRVSIRGSTIRSPFGVRNVKVYWNQIPLTDPGGNTYLNQLDPAMIGAVEILKGPGSSLYGAGTGGVLLLGTGTLAEGNTLKAGLQFGSYGSQLYQLGYEESGHNTSHQVQLLHQQYGGYRDHTEMKRTVANSVFRFEVQEDQTLETFIFFSNLFYETPGGLTLTEFQTDPKQARPTTVTFPGAIEQNASVSLQSFYAGVAHEYLFSEHLHNRTSVYGNIVKFENPAIRNYDHRNEQSLGARSVTTFKKKLNNVQTTLLGGGEFQWGFLPVKSYQNMGGTEGALISDDEATALQYSIFGQMELNWNSFNFTAGLSYNGQTLDFHRLSDPDAEEERLKYDPEFMPRVAILWNASKSLSLFGGVSQGFSPPTLAEINASNGVFNRDLEPEKGTNFEAGIHSRLFGNIVQLDFTGYVFRLDETIVIRREEDGGEYFVNAGNTHQRGIELNVSYKPKLGAQEVINGLEAWLSYSYNHYRFGDYIKDQDDFSGNQLTGTPAHVVGAGIDLKSRNGIYARATCLYSSEIPLNDANSVYADPYLLPGIRLGYIHGRFELYAGMENALNESYSLGNDLNAAGGRYYNAAPGQSIYGGLKVNLSF